MKAETPKIECPDLHLRPDEPIGDSEHDDLNRGKLAESIASKILSRDIESCMVVGISGPWGSGKSSLLNLIKERIDEAAERKPGILVLQFNPWSYSTIDQLIAAFFKDLRSTLSLIDKAELAASIGNALDKLAFACIPLSLVPALQPAAAVSLVVSPIAKMMKSAAKSEPLAKIKADLDSFLNEAGIHLVVLIDDLDRAEPECVRLMLQLIRMNADFSATTYILAFDRERTARALSTSLGGTDEDGRDYLGKLIQVPFDLPVIESLRLKVEVADAANPIFDLIFNNPELDRHHREVMNAGFYDLFENIRDAKRFANALAVTLPLVWDEVNVVDFAVLEAIRLKLPLLYEKLHEDRWLLLNESRGLEEELEDYILRDKEPDRKGHQEKLDALLGFAGDSKDAIRAILEALFPQLSRLRHGKPPWRLPLNVVWSRQRLVCSSDHFDSYFFLTPGVLSISESELNEALDLAEAQDRAALGETLLKLDRQNKGTSLMRRISIRASDLSPNQVETVIGAFLDVSSHPDNWGHTAQDPGPLLSVGHYLAILTSAIEDKAHQLEVIRQSIANGLGLCGVIRFASSVLDVTIEGQPVLNDAGKAVVNAAVCQRLEAAAKSGELLSSPCTASLLYRWLEWNPERAKEHVRSLVQSTETLLPLLDRLRRTAGRYYSTGVYEEPNPSDFPKILLGIGEMEAVALASDTSKAILEQETNGEGAQTKLTPDQTEILRGFIQGACTLAKEGAPEEEQGNV